MHACLSTRCRTSRYQVAAGSTTSENSALLVIRKSVVVKTSTLPRGAVSRQVTSFGLTSGGDSSALTAGSLVPRRCFRKYSWLLPEEPSTLARQTVHTRGQFSGASGSSAAKRSFPAFNWLTTKTAGFCPAFSGSSTH